MIRVASIGECMLEIADRGDGTAGLAFAGDTYNTAYYLRHLSGPETSVAYISCLGTDALSEEMLKAWKGAGIDCGHVGRVEDRVPGAYMIRTSGSGERSFVYWRENAAARRLFQPPMAPAAEVLAGFDVLYLSGITLAILPPEVRAELTDAFRAARDRGAWTVFDPNYRTRLWPDTPAAQEAFRRIAAASAFVLPSFDDERTLFGDAEQTVTGERWRGWGAGRVVLKDGSDPVHLATPDGNRVVPVPGAGEVVDTTAAGDSFNAGALAVLIARLAREKRDPTLDELAEASLFGARVAAIVIGRRGALIDPELLPVP